MKREFTIVYYINHGRSVYDEKIKWFCQIKATSGAYDMLGFTMFIQNKFPTV